MVRTCAEAMLIEVVDEETDPPQTRIRQFLSRGELDKIVYTWADEMQFEQMCSPAVLARIFDAFDTDGDGVVSEVDLNGHISSLIAGRIGLSGEPGNREERVFGATTDGATDTEDDAVNLDTVPSEWPVESALNAVRNQVAVDSATLL